MWVTTSEIPLPNVDGTLRGYPGNGTDITEGNQGKKEILETNNHIEEIMARTMMASTAKSANLANMNHEFRTLMNEVIGMTRMLMDTNLDNEQRHYVEVVNASSASLMGLINDLFDFAKTQTKKLDMDRTDFDPSYFLDDVAKPVPPQVFVIYHSPMIYDRAGMMARLMDDEHLARKVVKCFLEDIPRQIIALKGYLEIGDNSGAEHQANTIRSAAGNVGGDALMAVAFEMEKLGKAGDLDAVKACMAELEAQFDRLNQAMTDEL